MPETLANLLILRTGDTAPLIVARHGNYDEWFTRQMRQMRCRFTVHGVPTGGIPDISGFDGILVTGTTASVLDHQGWMENLADFFRNLETVPGPPVLAVCFAAQLAAAALGGRVDRNPNGWEIGTIQVETSEAGRKSILFKGLPARFPVQATHEDRIAVLPPGDPCLASSRLTPIQAFSHGARLLAVQFHPEANAPLLRDLMGLRREVLEEDAARQGNCSQDEALQAVDNLQSSVRESPWGRLILENWLRFKVRSRPSEKAGGIHRLTVAAGSGPAPGRSAQPEQRRLPIGAAGPAEPGDPPAPVPGAPPSGDGDR